MLVQFGNNWIKKIPRTANPISLKLKPIRFEQCDSDAQSL